MAAVFQVLPAPHVVLTPELVIVTANEAYCTITGRTVEELRGRRLFEAFPPAPDALDETGVPRVQVVLERVARTGTAEMLPTQRYDIADPSTGEQRERYWVLSAAPVVSAEGRTTLLVQRTEDVTDFMLQREQGQEAIASGEPWRRRVQAVEAELVTLARDLSAALEAAATAAKEVAALNGVALELASAQTVQDVEAIVVGKAVVALGADGGAVVTPSDAGWRVTVNAALGEHVQAVYGELPHDSPLPACVVARTGERLLLPTRASGLAFHPDMATVYTDTARDGWAFFPLFVDGRTIGSLAVSWREPHECTRRELDLLEGFAAQCAQALDRTSLADVQRGVDAAVARMAEGLQRSLLARLPEPDHLHLVARYAPAAHAAQTGGDWYDAFLRRDGSTCLVVGDIAGHDSDAAVAMAQVRNVLRGVAHALSDPPAVVLAALDLAMRDLAVGTLVTAVLATIEQGPADEALGLRTLRWSNAGHPPPLLILPDGTAELLERPVDLLLGLLPGTPRLDHIHVLPPGSTVLLYTDGLIERRGEDVDVGLERLRRHAGTLVGLPLELLCDALVADLGGDTDDDVVLLAVRAHREDAPRPYEAGPQVLPADLREQPVG